MRSMKTMKLTFNLLAEDTAGRGWVHVGLTRKQIIANEDEAVPEFSNFSKETQVQLRDIAWILTVVN